MAKPDSLKHFLLFPLLFWISSLSGLEVGTAAPDFKLMGSDGNTHRLEDYRGRTVVLAWFPKAFTGG